MAWKPAQAQANLPRGAAGAGCCSKQGCRGGRDGDLPRHRNTHRKMKIGSKKIIVPSLLIASSVADAALTSP